MFHGICSTYDMERANKSPNRMQLTVPCIQKGVGKKKSGHWNTQIYHQLFIHFLMVKGCLFQNPPDSFSIDCDEEEENTPEETQ